MKFPAVATVEPSPSYGLKSAAPEIMTPIVPRLVAVVLAAFLGFVGIVKSYDCASVGSVAAWAVAALGTRTPSFGRAYSACRA